MRPAHYRAYQFFAALGAYLPAWAGGRRGNLSAEDRTLVELILPMPVQQQLFARMSPNDQRHAMAVARTIWQAGHRNPALLQAALLHDVAKCLGQPIFHRVLIVILETLWPAALSRLSGQSKTLNLQISDIPGWRRPFVIHAHHPAIGAAWANEVGCEPLAVGLIEKHQAQLTDQASEAAQLLALLQWADNLN